MKVKIPFKLFGDQEGELEFDYPFDLGFIHRGKKREIEKRATMDAQRIAYYLGTFKDVFQRAVLGYERAPGIEHVFQTLIDCDTDDVLRARIRELHSERCEREQDG